MEAWFKTRTGVEIAEGEDAAWFYLEPEIWADYFPSGWMGVGGGDGLPAAYRRSFSGDSFQ